MVAENRNARVSGNPGASENVSRGSGQSEDTTTLTWTEHLCECERRNVRRVWWDQWALGHRLPAERGIIVMPGGAR